MINDPDKFQIVDRLMSDPETAKQIRAVLGEYCVCLTFNVPFAHDPTSSDNPFDLKLPSGRRAMVESRQSSPDRFSILEEIGVLVYLKDNVGELNSYISHAKFWKLCKFEKTKCGDGMYVIEVADMENIDGLVQFEGNLMNGPTLTMNEIYSSHHDKT